ncbi:coenzyme F420-0:L-glutamate ligase [Candidatus Haliotispira prima]|uniref:Coenzyme F420-0:L-glutamate ligase n=1 Tax=Candidatus Haliotispira prima TaxID=3034016 RepID=A0ABY8MLK2_9SPIO|nr:coenzyme F420-0:L-glutamate ligase [Candidatus Haliotispira prima]
MSLPASPPPPPSSPYPLSSAHCGIYPLRLPRLRPPQQDLLRALFSTLDTLKKQQAFSLQDGDIICLSAKVVAIHQGRCLHLKSKQERQALVKQEADYYIPNTLPPQPANNRKPSNEEPGNREPNNGENTEKRGIDFPFTLKGKTPVPFSGVDESNGAGWHILWPERLQETAHSLKEAIASYSQIDKLGLIITDSTVFPLRRGCIGISIAASGVQLLRSYLGQKDLFGRELKLSESNIVDSLAGFATLFMGEGAEQTPAVVLRGLEQHPSQQTEDGQDFPALFIDPKQDFYGPLFNGTKNTAK